MTRLLIDLALVAVAYACARLLEYCHSSNCRAAFAWRRRTLDDGTTQPFCRKCAAQLDRIRKARVRRHLALRIEQ